MDTGVCSLGHMFIFNFCGQKCIFIMVVNLVHESMFSIFVFMMLQGKGFPQSLW